MDSSIVFMGMLWLVESHVFLIPLWIEFPIIYAHVHACNVEPIPKHILWVSARNYLSNNLLQGVELIW